MCCSDFTSRGRQWYAALKADMILEEGLYEKLAARAPSVKSKELCVLDKDIGRTFPERACFQSAHHGCSGLPR